MGLFSFLKNAGEKLFGSSDSPEEKAQKVIEHLNEQSFDLSKIQVTVKDSTVYLIGQTESFEEKQRILATAGNVEGIESVEDNLTFEAPAEILVEKEEDTFYTVQKGDYLSKISKAVYGDANKYNIIFDANKPMLSHPDKIYPGQVLFIPPIK